MTRHDWYLAGGADWEVWRCRRCGKTQIPFLFFLWPTRCKG